MRSSNVWDHNHGITAFMGLDDQISKIRIMGSWKNDSWDHRIIHLLTRGERSKTTRSSSVLISGYVQLFLTCVNIRSFLCPNILCPNIWCPHIPSFVCAIIFGHFLCPHILCPHILCPHIPSFANHISILKGFFIFLYFSISDPKIEGILVFFTPIFFTFLPPLLFLPIFYPYFFLTSHLFLYHHFLFTPTFRPPIFLPSLFVWLFLPPIFFDFHF